MRISDWSSDVCSSDLSTRSPWRHPLPFCSWRRRLMQPVVAGGATSIIPAAAMAAPAPAAPRAVAAALAVLHRHQHLPAPARPLHRVRRSEEHTSELQSLMRISYAVFCLTKKKK